MIKTLFSSSGFSTKLTSEEIFFIADAAKNNSLLGIKTDETNDELKIYFKDNGNTAANEVLTIDTVNGKAATAAEDIINALNGILKNSQVVKPTECTTHVTGANGVQFPAFTITNSDVTISATATDDFTFTLASATIGCTFSAVLSMDDDSHTFTKTGTIATPTDAITFDSTDFSAGNATIAVTLTNPKQPGVTRAVSQAAVILS
jgi:hypothetical protein